MWYFGIFWYFWHFLKKITHIQWKISKNHHFAFENCSNRSKKKNGPIEKIDFLRSKKIFGPPKIDIFDGSKNSLAADLTTFWRQNDDVFGILHWFWVICHRKSHIIAQYITCSVWVHTIWKICACRMCLYTQSDVFGYYLTCSMTNHPKSVKNRKESSFWLRKVLKSPQISFSTHSQEISKNS